MNFILKLILINYILRASSAARTSQEGLSDKLYSNINFKPKLVLINYREVHPQPGPHKKAYLTNYSYMNLILELVLINYILRGLPPARTL